MAKRTSKKTKVKQNPESLKQIRYLEILLENTNRAIDGKSLELDALFTNQGKRLQDQINKLKEKQ